jgi:hypothetical protein
MGWVRRTGVSEAAADYIATKVPEANIRNLDAADFTMFFDLYDRVLRGAKQDVKLVSLWAKLPKSIKSNTLTVLSNKVVAEAGKSISFRFRI